MPPRGRGSRPDSRRGRMSETVAFLGGLYRRGHLRPGRVQGGKQPGGTMKTAMAKGVLASFALMASVRGVSAQDWPQWRGPNRDNKVTGFTAPKAWPKALAKKWQAKVGDGVSSPVLAGGKVYVFGREGTQEVTTCLDRKR